MAEKTNKIFYLFIFGNCNFTKICQISTEIQTNLQMAAFLPKIISGGQMYSKQTFLHMKENKLPLPSCVCLFIF